MFRQVQQLWEKLKYYLRKFNLFPSMPPGNDQYQLRNEIISTRLFILLFILSFGILLLYTSLITIRKTINVKTPSFIEYKRLNSTYSETLTCPCTKISIDYDEILHVSYTFHQVCTSIFITKNWTDFFSLTTSSDRISFPILDFRLIATYAFQALRSFCELVDQTISDEINGFYFNQYVSAFVIPYDLFKSQVQVSIAQFRSSIIDSFWSSLSIIRQTTQGNALFSIIQIAYRLYLDTSSMDIYMSSIKHDNCSCSSSATCVGQSNIYSYPNTQILSSVPNFYVGCYVIEALLQSTLECFYDQNCIDTIQSYVTYSSPLMVTALNSSVPSNYNINSTVNELLQQLMIEKWNISIMYENYYEQCKPAECIYSYETRNDAIYIITILIGLVGGLVTGLKLVVPYLVKLLRRKREEDEPAAIVLKIHERMAILWQTFKQSVRNLNLFPSMPPANDQYQLRNEIISTRLFILLFILSFGILLLYTSLITIRKTINVKTPSFIEYKRLNSTYSQTLTCPCTKISIDYDEILHVNYTFHQVCTSIFITKSWIDYIDSTNTEIVIFHNDFRATATYTFQTLKSFCELVNQTISNSLREFYSSKYISASVTSFALFPSQIETLINQFQLSMIDKFLLSFSIIRQTTQGNVLISALMTNYALGVPSGTRYAGSGSLEYSECSCAISATCVEQSSFYNYPNIISIFSLPGIYTGCYVVEALLQSTLECFYDQNCTDTIQSHLSYPSPFVVRALNSSVPSNYHINTTVNELLQQLMIEKWNISIMYENYYEQCKPAECIYSYETRNDAIYIITILIGLVGGLVTGLKLVVPYLVKLLRRKREEDEPAATILKIHERMAILWQTLKQSVRILNLFPSMPPENDQYQLRNEIISTRLFILLFMSLFGILLLYTSLITIRKTISVKTPSFIEYKRLNSTYSQTLTCPCTKISIDYDEILHVNYTFHQVCTSIFITKNWIDYIYNGRAAGLWSHDFRVQAPGSFLTLAGFCELVNQTVSGRLNGFYSNEFISLSVIPYDLFQSQAMTLISAFKLSTISSVLSSLYMIRQTSQVNIILSGLLTNYNLYRELNSDRIVMAPNIYADCNCASTPLCVDQSYIYEQYNRNKLMAIPGFLIGCYMVEALLQSTLECFYDQNCTDTIQSHLSDPSPFKVTALNSSVPSNYHTNSTVNELLQQLMIEQWNISIMYENYYEQCKPAECIYSYETRNDAIYIITTLIGLVGGLVTGLKVVVPLAVKLIVYCIRKCKTRVVPEMLNFE